MYLRNLVCIHTYIRTKTIHNFQLCGWALKKEYKTSEKKVFFLNFRNVAWSMMSKFSVVRFRGHRKWNNEGPLVFRTASNTLSWPRGAIIDFIVFLILWHIKIKCHSEVYELFAIFAPWGTILKLTVYSFTVYSLLCIDLLCTA